jgi:hypothetical protein
MAEMIYALLALMPVVGYFLFYQLQQYRFKKFAHIPTPIKPNIFLGHLGSMAAGFKKFGDSKVHPGTVEN